MSDSDQTTPDLQSVLQQARALIDRRRYEQARQLLGTGIQHDPDNAQLLYLCAFVDYSLGDLASANETISRVLVAEPKHYGGRILRAELYESEKHYPEAEAVWIDLLRDYPQDPECYAHYADLMLRTLHFEKAERLTQEGLRLDPTHWQCLYVAYLVDVIQNRTSSIDNTHLQQLLKDHPERVQSLLALIIALDERGDSKGALRVAQQVLATRPDSEHYVNMVRALKRQNHWSLLPLYPMRRWGWNGAAVVTAIGIIGVRFAGHTLPPDIAMAIAYVWLAYVIYSWVWPRILRKLI